MKPILFGSAVGIVSSVIWFSIAMVSGYEVGWVAIIIGIIVGLSIHATNEDNEVELPIVGIIAVIIAVVSIFSGKYFTHNTLYSRNLSNALSNASQTVFDNDQYVISLLADMAVQKLEESNYKLIWPGGTKPEVANNKSDYPPVAWEAAENMWAEMDSSEREELKEAVRAEFHENIKTAVGPNTFQSFINAFEGIDILFLFLAGYFAFKAAVGKANEVV